MADKKISAWTTSTTHPVATDVFPTIESMGGSPAHKIKSWATLTGGDLTSGSYTPNLFNTTNVAASTAYVCQYLRVGIAVTVSGLVDIDTTGAGGTQLDMSIPIASSLAAVQQLAGTAVSATGEAARIYADFANDRATIIFTAVTTTNQNWTFTFTYLVV